MFFPYENTTLTELSGGVRRRILANDEKMMAVEVDFDEGAVGAMHTHPHEQISYVLSGEFSATIGDEVRLIKAGDTYYTKPNEPHGVVCLKAGRLLDIFTPRREDFLK